jgi:hypothetical protein
MWSELDAAEMRRLKSQFESAARCASRLAERPIWYCRDQSRKHRSIRLRLKGHPGGFELRPAWLADWIKKPVL